MDSRLKRSKIELMQRLLVNLHIHCAARRAVLCEHCEVLQSCDDILILDTFGFADCQTGQQERVLAHLVLAAAKVCRTGNIKLRTKLYVAGDGLVLRTADLAVVISAVSYTHLDVYKRQDL